MQLALQQFWLDIREHKALTARAIITGFVTLFALWILLATRLARLDDWLFQTGLADIRWLWRGGRHPFAHFLIGGSLNFAVGWIVGRTHRRYALPMVFVFFAVLIVFIDLPRVIPAALEASRNADVFIRFFGVGLSDFIFLRLPIIAGALLAARPGKVRSLGSTLKVSFR